MQTITINKLLQNRATDKELKIFWLAVKTLKSNKCGIERYNTAKKTLYWLNRVNSARERELEYDSYEWGQKRAEIIAKRIEEDIQPHLEKHAKKLGLVIDWSTWCHLAVKGTHNWVA